MRKLSSILVFVLLLSSTLPFYGSFDNVVPSEEDKLALLLGEKILICTVYGPKLVDINGEEVPDSQTTSKCPLCILNNGSDNATSVLTEYYVVQQPIKKLRFRVSGHYSITEKSYQSFSVRAPPISFIS